MIFRIKMFLFIFILGSLNSKSFASEGVFLKYAVGAQKDLSEQKAFAVGYQSGLSFFEMKTEAGFWVDNTRKAGASNSGFISGAIGVEPEAGSLYVNFFQGVGLISSPDTVLGGPVQFFEDIGLGIRDKKTKVSVGLLYKHISSAGLFKPNKGRDFLGVQVMFPW